MGFLITNLLKENQESENKSTNIVRDHYTNPQEQHIWRGLLSMVEHNKKTTLSFWDLSTEILMLHFGSLLGEFIEPQRLILFTA